MNKPADNRPQRPRPPGIMIGAALLMVALGLVVTRTTQPPALSVPAYGASPAAATATGTSPVPTAAGTATQGYLDGLRATAVAIAATLPTASPLPGWPVDKAADIQQRDLMGRAYATANALDPTPPGYRIPHPPTSAVPKPTEPMWSAGAGVIYDEAGPTEFDKQVHIVNFWWETMGDERLLVCAGRTLSLTEPSQGAILIALENAATGSIIGTPQMYPTPSRQGYVRVIDAVGERLTLRAEDGALFYFDVPSRQWVSP